MSDHEPFGHSISLPSVDLRLRPDVAVVALIGEHDALTAAQVTSEIEQWLPTRGVVVDLNDATFIDSAILRALVQGWRSASAAGREFSVCIRDGHALRRVLEVAGLDAAFPIVAAVPTEA